MSQRDYDVMEDAIRDNRDIDDMVREIERDMGKRKVDSIQDQAIKSAETIDEVIRPNEKFETILVTCFAAHLGIVCKESLRMRLPRSIEDIIDEVDGALRDATRGSSRGRDRDRDRDRGRDRGRDNRRRNDRDRDDRDNRDRGERRGGGFGKSKKRDRRDDRDREEQTREPSYKGTKTVAFDRARRKLVEGSLVENYEDHELTAIAKTFSTSNIEQHRQKFVEDARSDAKEYLPGQFDSWNDFVNMTADGALEVGMVTRKSTYVFAGDFMNDIYIRANDTDYVKFVMGMLTMTTNSEDPTTVRFRRRLNKLALDALYITFNMYSKVGADLEGEAVEEWEAIQADLDKPEIFDPMVTDEVREVFKGLLANFARMEYDEDSKALTVSSLFFCGKVSGAFIERTDIAGEERLAEVTSDYHPELNAAATAIVEVRDSYLGDAWSTHGVIPVVATDTLGKPMFVIANKASTSKYILSSLFPTAFIS